jgi:hypothetical protein
MNRISIILVISMMSFEVVAEPNFPKGERVFSEFFSIFQKDLKNELLCQADIKLFELFSLSLSTSYDTENSTYISSSCTPSKFDVSDNRTIDIWDCTIQINEDNPGGEFISSSTYVFGLSKNTHKYVDGSLRCR